jgi:hypothetical protein
MSLLANVLGFSAFGFATRCFQLGLQKRFMFEGMSPLSRSLLLRVQEADYLGWVGGCVAPQTHLMAMAGFGAAGWGVYELEQRQ